MLYVYLYGLCGHAGMTLVQVWDIYETQTFPVTDRHRHRRHRPRPQAVWVLLPPTGRTYGPHVPWKQEMGVHSNHPSHETISVLKPMVSGVPPCYRKPPIVEKLS